MELMIPSEYIHHECDDVKYAYENGFYDGRDEAYDSFEEVDASNICEWLNEAISDYGPMHKLSEAANVAEVTLQRWKRGVIPRFELLSYVCDELGYSICLVKKE